MAGFKEIAREPEARLSALSVHVNGGFIPEGRQQLQKEKPCSPFGEE